MLFRILTEGGAESADPGSSCMPSERRVACPSASLGVLNTAAGVLEGEGATSGTGVGTRTWIPLSVSPSAQSPLAPI